MAALLFTASISALLCCASAAPTNWPWLSPQTRTFPAGFNLLSVKDASLPNGGARGDGKTDDWLAIQTAINTTQQFAPTYFPAGTYAISQPLRFPVYHGGIESRHGVVGESVLTTVIRVMDHSPAFQDTRSPTAVLVIGGGVAQDFYNFVEGLTISTGVGNCGATGLRFDGNNMADVRNVSIVSGDPSGCGATGLDFDYCDQIGPLLVKWLFVSGFQVGVNISHNVDSQTFEHVTLTGQSVHGLANYGQVATVRDLRVEGEGAGYVPLHHTSNEGNVAFLTLLDSTLVNTGTAPLPVAVNSSVGMAFLRNVSVVGAFQYALVHEPSAAIPPPAPPPVGCANTTVLNDVAGNSRQVSYTTVANSSVCCNECEVWSAANPTNPCLLWTFTTDEPAHNCFLHDGTSVYPRGSTVSGTIDTQVLRARAPRPSGRTATSAWPPTCGTLANETQCVAGPLIVEWTSHPVVTLWPGARNTSLSLPVLETPEPQAEDGSAWHIALGPSAANGTWPCMQHEDHHCPNPVSGGNYTCWVPDCAPLVQATLDAGAHTVWLPNRSAYPSVWLLNANVSVPRTTLRINGMGSSLGGLGWLLIAEGDETDPPLVIERLIAPDNAANVVFHSSRRTVVLRDSSGWAYAADCTAQGGVGDVFLEDTVSTPMHFCGGQRVWARQLNLENTDVDATVSGGAALWVLGLKTERGDAGVLSVDGPGTAAEVLGFFAYSTDDAKKAYVFNISNGAALSGAFREYNANCKGLFGPTLVVEQGRGSAAGESRALEKNFTATPGLAPGHGNPSACLSNFTGDTRSAGFALFVSQPRTAGAGA